MNNVFAKIVYLAIGLALCFNSNAASSPLINANRAQVIAQLGTPHRLISLKNREYFIYLGEPSCQILVNIKEGSVNSVLITGNNGKRLRGSTCQLLASLEENKTETIT